uniref:Chitin-binding type-4 domain-containing protein n=1 Tax=Odontella aurita TaxID=265563 RepID=A0A7S4JER8_9STRA
MTIPKPRQPESLYWYQVGCMIGCKCSGGGKEMYPTLESVGCDTPAEPTNPVRTWNNENTSPKGDWNKYMPWRSPGSAIPLDSCGVAGGFLLTAAVQYSHSFLDESIKQGTKGTSLPPGEIAVWEAGSIVEASFYLTVNHGGGYQYRVCPSDSVLDETCFESNPLAFATQDHIVMHGPRNFTIPAVDVTDGVRPSGSSWRRLPIPACNCDLGSGCTLLSDNEELRSYEEGESHGTCGTGVQFEAPHLSNGVWPDGYGYFIATLGGSESKEDASICIKHQDAEACLADTTNGCKWYGEKNVCYETRTKKDSSNCEAHNGDQKSCAQVDGCTWYGNGKDVCNEVKEKESKFGCAAYNGDQTSCAQVDGCSWYGNGKNVCYNTIDTKDNQGSKESDSPHKGEWHIVDKLLAPSDPGNYIFQWRWDNEQTPQIWTTCADVTVTALNDAKLKSANGGANAMTPTVALICVIIWASIVAVQTLIG